MTFNVDDSGRRERSGEEVPARRKPNPKDTTQQHSAKLALTQTSGGQASHI